MNKPKLVIYGDVSVDGRLTVGPDVLLLYGDERWSALAPPSDALDWLKATHKPQAMLEGSGSFLTDGTLPEPLPPVVGDTSALYQDYLPEAVLRRPGREGWFVVTDARGRVRWYYTGEPGKEAPGAEAWHLLVLVTRQTPAAYLAFLQTESVPYLIAGEGERVDLALALEKLAEQLGVACVITTSPGKLGGALLRAGLVDEVDLDFFPALIGGTRTPTLFESPELRAEEWPARLKLISARSGADGRVWLRYEVLRE